MPTHKLQGTFDNVWRQFGCHSWPGGVLLASSGWNCRHNARDSLHAKDIHPQRLIVLRLRNCPAPTVHSAEAPQPSTKRPLVSSPHTSVRETSPSFCVPCKLQDLDPQQREGQMSLLPGSHLFPYLPGEFSYPQARAGEGVLMAGWYRAGDTPACIPPACALATVLLKHRGAGRGAFSTPSGLFSSVHT